MTIGLLLDDTLDRSDGVQQAVTMIGRDLSSRGHDVHYIVPDTTRTDIANIHSIGKSISMKFNGNSVRTPLPISKKSIIKLLSEINFDVMHVQMPYSPFLSARIIKLAASKVFVAGTFHILPYNNISIIGNKLLGFALRNSKKRINRSFAVSEPAQKFMLKSFAIEGDILPNPVNYNFYHKFERQNNNKKQLVYVGRFEKRKGVRELIIAYSNLPKDLLDNSELTMCGRGPMLDDMKKLSFKLNIKINFPGFVDENEKAQYLANADIAVFPSLSGESFGIVLTEAMSAGAGITIGGNNLGYSSVLSSWPLSIFDPSSSIQFTELLSRLLVDDNLRLKIGRSQHKEVKKYDIKYVVDILESCYKSRKV